MMSFSGYHDWNIDIGSMRRSTADQGYRKAEAGPQRGRGLPVPQPPRRDGNIQDTPHVETQPASERCWLTHRRSLAGARIGSRDVAPRRNASPRALIRAERTLLPFSSAIKRRNELSKFNQQVFPTKATLRRIYLHPLARWKASIPRIKGGCDLITCSSCLPHLLAYSFTPIHP